MSVYAMVWAYQQEVEHSGRKFTLVTAAQYANEDGVCWVGQETLAADMSMGVSTVRRHLHDLEVAGIIERVERRRKDGTRTSDLIKLLGFDSPNRSKRADAKPTTAQIEHDNRSNRAGRNVSKETSYKGANAPSADQPQKAGRKSGNTKKAPTNTQYLMDRIYEALKENRLSLDGGEYAYNLGKVGEVLEKEEPTGRELSELPDACVEYFDWYGKLDVRKALRRYRQQERRQQRKGDQASARERESEQRERERWRAPQAAVEAVRNHAELSRYTELLKRWDPTTTEIPQGAFLGLGADDTERWKNQARIESVARRAAGVSVIQKGDDADETVKDAIDDLVEDKKLPPTFDQYLKESEVDPNDLDEAARNVLMDIYEREKTKEKKKQENDDG